MSVHTLYNVEKFHISAVELTLIYDVRYSRAVHLASMLTAAMDEFHISKTPARRNMFLAQIAHESRFRAKAENMNYTSEQLMKTWKDRFPTIDSTKAFARNPSKIGNFVYGSRMKNGGEGYRYRGRGGIQITGKENYSQLSKDLKLGKKLVDKPDLLLNDNLAWRSSAWFWSKNGLNELMDKNPYDIEKATQFINNGCNGFKDRFKQFVKILNLLGGIEGGYSAEHVSPNCLPKKVRIQQDKIRNKPKPGHAKTDNGR